MRYDPEYKSYKFSDEEISNIIHALICYSSDGFIDKITQKNVRTLLDDLNKSTKIPVAQ